MFWDMLSLIKAQVCAGGFYALENPTASSVFETVGVCELLPSGSFRVEWDMCSYDLRPPGGGCCDFVLKKTSIITNVPDLRGLAKVCPGTGPCHIHHNAWGRGWDPIQKRRVSKAKAAGRYPSVFCMRYAELFHSFLRSRGWC